MYSIMPTRAPAAIRDASHPAPNCTHFDVSGFHGKPGRLRADGVNRRRRMTSVQRPLLTLRKRDTLTVLIEKCLLISGQFPTPLRPNSWSNFNARSQS